MTHTDDVPADGSAAAALHMLRDWLTVAVAGTGEVVLGPPDGADVAVPRLRMWPVALLRDQTTRGGHGAQAVRLRARYAVAPEGPIPDAVRLLDRVLVATVGQDTIALVVEPATGGVRVPPPATTLAIQLDLPVHIVPARPAVPRVRGELRLSGSPLCEINGRLVGPDDVPLAGLTVTAPITGAATVSGARGEFRLPGLPGGRVIALHISGRGLHLQVEVPAETADPVVVHCVFEEV